MISRSRSSARVGFSSGLWNGARKIPKRIAYLRSALRRRAPALTRSIRERAPATLSAADRSEEATMAKIFHDSDAPLTALDGKRVAVVGYGNQGRAWALNLRDSGVD